jgi:Protein of unknown function DUF262
VQILALCDTGRPATKFGRQTLAILALRAQLPRKRRRMTDAHAEREQDIADFDERYEQDIEEDEEQLDAEEETDPVAFWEQKQRDLVTSVLDYNLQTLSALIQDKNIDLSPRYQRRFRWDQKRQSTLIESFLMNVPVPPIFLNEDELGKYSVIDGKQRLSYLRRSPAESSKRDSDESKPPSHYHPATVRPRR